MKRSVEFYENIQKQILDGIKTMKDCKVKYNKLEINPQYVLDMIEDIEILKKALELATENCDNYWEEISAQKKKISLYDYFIKQAKGEKDE